MASFCEPAAERLRQGVLGRVFPGACVCFGSRDRHRVAWAGRATYAEASPEVTDDTVWDLASVSKVMGTTTVAMRLADQGKLDLDAAVSSLVTDFVGEGKSGVRVRHLLTHSSGLPAYLNPKAGESARNAVVSCPLRVEPGTDTVYSCLGFITLQQVLESVTGSRLDQLFDRLVAQPLKLTTAGYRPARNLRERCAPTTWLTPAIRTEMAARGLEPAHAEFIQGTVHDPLAWAMGGVSGNAGLFATAGDVAHLLQAWLNGGEWEGTRLVRESTLLAWTSRQSDGSTRGLGWDTKSDSTDTSAGEKMSAIAFGHTGYTGTSVWVDPERGLYAAIMTSRVHPDDADTGLQAFRRAFHDDMADWI